MDIEDSKLTRTHHLIDERKLGGLIVYSNGTCSITLPRYLHYFAGFRPMGPNNAAIVSNSGRVVLLVEPAWDARRARRQSWIDDVRGTNDFPGSLIGALRTLEITGEVGLAGGSEMSQPLYEVLGNHMAVQPADDILEAMAQEKSPEDLELVRRASAIADAGFEAFLACSRVGVREYELVAEMEYAMRCAGADDAFMVVGSGPHNTAMQAATDRQFAPGDIIIGEISPICRGQAVQLCRTVVLGEPSAQLEEKYKLLLRAFEEAAGQVKANVPASIIATTIDGILATAGYGKYCQPPYMRTRGHGFGVGSVSPGGVIDSRTDIPLLENQVVVVHPNQYLPETGYLACGEMFLVTASGAERLSRTETRLYVNA